MANRVTRVNRTDSYLLYQHKPAGQRGMGFRNRVCGRAHIRAGRAAERPLSTQPGTATATLSLDVLCQIFRVQPYWGTLQQVIMQPVILIR